jgi:2-polyprenyl-3-methyl-5-hydroxy-6-metoxy-1,4-benzoquinol methylase
MVDLNIKELPNEGSVLDVGCGDGYVCSLLKKRGLYVEGFDNSVIAVKLAQELLPDVKIHLADVETISLDRHFDYFIAQNVIEHLNKPESLVKLFEDYCDKYMILATDIPEGKVGKYEYYSFSFEDICRIFGEFKVEKLYGFRKVYGVRISKWIH